MEVDWAIFMFQHVLICTDLTDGLQRLMQFVPSLAAGGMKSIVFLHVMPLPDEAIPRQDDTRIRALRDRLSAHLAPAPQGVEVKLEVLMGKPADLILPAIKTHASELLIIGMPSRSLLNEKLFGSTTMDICGRVQIPVLTFRPHLISSLTREELDLRCKHLFRHLLIPYDGSKAGNYLIGKIQELVRQHTPNSLEHCLLSTVVDEVNRDPNLGNMELQQAQVQLAEAATRMEAAGLKTETQVRSGNAVAEVLESAQDWGASAIATASDSLGGLRELPAPSFSGELLRKSWHPVLYFPVPR